MFFKCGFTECSVGGIRLECEESSKSDSELGGDQEFGSEDEYSL